MDPLDLHTTYANTRVFFLFIPFLVVCVDGLPAIALLRTMIWAFWGEPLVFPHANRALDDRRQPSILFQRGAARTLSTLIAYASNSMS